MLFSKVWMFLLAVALAVAFGTAFLAPRPASREATRYYAENLDRSQHSAQLMLRIEARKWMDIATKVAMDRTLIEGMEQASDGVSNVQQIKQRLNNRVVQILSRLERDQRPKLVITVDIKGKQIYRMSPNDPGYVPGKVGLIGYPLVEDALRGYRRDDLWNIDGKLFMLAATPIISRAKGRYVGALILGEQIDDAFARKFKKHLGNLEVAFFLRGKLVGSTANSQGVVRLPTRYGSKQRQAEVAKNGRSMTVLVKDGDATFYTIMTPLPGEASLHQAFYAVFKTPPPTIGLPEAVRMLGGSDLTSGHFPWLLLGGGLLGVLVVGFLLMFWEVNMPVGRLHSDLKKLAQGEALRLDPKNFSGKFRLITQSINKGLERAHKQAPLGITRDGSTAEADQPEDRGKRDRSSKKAKPMKARADEMPPMAVEEKPARRVAPMELAPEEPGLDESLGPGVRSLGGLGDPEDAPTEIQVQPRFGEEDDRLPRDTDVAQPLLGGGAAQAFGEPTPIPAGIEAEVGGSHREVQIPESERSPLEQSAADSVVSSAPWQGEAPTNEAELEPYMDKVYEEFMSVKRQCGEDTSNLTYERFRKKLSKNRKALMERYECRTVKFQVYIKDGKAALKATPIKD